MTIREADKIRSVLNELRRHDPSNYVWLAIRRIEEILDTSIDYGDYRSIDDDDRPIGIGRADY